MVRIFSICMTILALAVAGSTQEAASRATADAPHIGLSADWSTRHLITSRVWNGDAAQATRNEPRTIVNWFYRNSAAGTVIATKTRQKFGGVRRQQIDWNFSLGAGRVAPDMSPAKYSFSLTATPTCADNAGTGVLADFVVYGLDNATVNNTNPNLVAFKKLYVNPLGTGSCSGTTPDVKFAYAINTGISGKILTSPSISLDGKKVAFIEGPPRDPSSTC